MAADAGGPARSAKFDPPLSSITSRAMGELQRGELRWDVLLETVKDVEAGVIRGRVHFATGSTHRLSGWIFLEWAEKDIEKRFSEFSAQELWNLLDSLDR